MPGTWAHMWCVVAPQAYFPKVILNNSDDVVIAAAATAAAEELNHGLLYHICLLTHARVNDFRIRFDSGTAHVPQTDDVSLNQQNFTINSVHINIQKIKNESRQWNNANGDGL